MGQDHQRQGGGKLTPMGDEREDPAVPTEPLRTAPAGREVDPARRQDPSGRRGGRRSAYATRDLTTGSIPRNLLFLAWPATVNGSLRMVDQLADLVWAGFFGSLAIAGLGVAQQMTTRYSPRFNPPTSAES